MTKTYPTPRVDSYDSNSIIEAFGPVSCGSSFVGPRQGGPIGYLTEGRNGSVIRNQR